MYRIAPTSARSKETPVPGPNTRLTPPTLPAVLSGAALEETAFFRDEQANLVWAVEWLGRRVKGGRGEGSSGLAWDRTEPPPGA
jgi:hypothetical protein